MRWPLISDDSIMKLVVDFVDVNSNQHWESFEHLIPNSIILRIVVVQLVMEGKSDDQFFWANSQWGEFSIKSAYAVITENNTDVENSHWTLTWK